MINQTIRFVRDMVSLIHKCSLKTNYISRGIVSNVLGGKMVQFVPLDGNESGILI